MPNHCSNNLTLRGDLTAFYEKLGKKFSFEAFVPMPKELEGIIAGSCMIDGRMVDGYRDVNGTPTAIPDSEHKDHIEKYGAQNWYDWNISNWGTKWDAYEVEERVRQPREYVVTFDTAWSPPREFVETLSGMFPRLDIELAYAEGGCAFWGVDAYQGGDHQWAKSGDDFWRERPDDVSEEEWDEMDSREHVTDAVYEHLETYHLHTGG